MDKEDGDTESYSVTEKNKILTFVTIWMDFKGIQLSEIGQMKTDTVWPYLSVGSKIKKTPKNKLVVQNRLGVGM